MKENQLVWKRMSLCERKWASVKVRVNPLLSTRLAKPHPANARQTTWTQRHPGILSVQSSPYCIIASNWSGCLVWPLRPGPLPAAQGGGGALPLLQLRLLSSAKVLGKWSASKAQKGGSQIFSNKVTHPIFFLIFTTFNPDFLAQRTCSTCGSILKNTRRRWSSSWNAQWALLRRKKR